MVTYLKKLEAVAEEYVNSISLNNVFGLAIVIPGFRGWFDIYNIEQLWRFFEPDETRPELCFVLNLNC